MGPVFLLFLDATFQIYSQFPCSFEFTHKILGTNMHQNVSNIFVNWSDRDMGNPVERHGLLHSDAGSDKKRQVLLGVIGEPAAITNVRTDG